MNSEIRNHFVSKKLLISISSVLLSGILLVNASTIVRADEATINPSQNSGVTSQADTQIEKIAEETNQQSMVNQAIYNLLKNGDFSQLEDKQGYWTGTKAIGWTAWIDNNYKDNTPSRKIEVIDQAVMLSSSEPFRAVVHQELTVDASKKYKLRFKIKAENKTGAAYVRIIEGEGAQKNLWYSEKISGTTDWKVLEKDYVPLSAAKKIKIELFYDKGTGSVSFKDVELVENGNKVEEKPQETERGIEDKIDLPLGKKYVLNKVEYNYSIENSTIASVKNGIVEPLKEGLTNIKVEKDGKVVKTIPLTVTRSAKDQYSQLLEDWNDIIAGNRYFNPKDPYMSTFNKELEDKVTENLKTISSKENRTYLWEKLANYETSSNLTATYRKLEEMAKQITNPHSSYYQDANVIRTVREAMEWLHKNVYNSSKNIVGNWWDYEIGTPRAINNTLSLMQEYFSNDEIKTYTDVIEKFVPDPEYFRKTTTPFKALGGNLVDMGRVKIIAGLLRKDKQEVAATIRSIEQVFTLVNSGEGFYPDGSYIDHTNVAYTGAYGNVLIDGLSQLLPIIQKTSTPIATEKMKTMYHWIDKSFLPLIVHGELMDLSRGRSISRANSEDHVAAVEVLRGIHRIAEMSDEATKQKLKSIIKTVIQSDTFYNVFNNLKTYRDISLMENLLNDASVATISRESYLSAFNAMDKLALYHAEKDFGFGLSMFSSRTKNYEGMNKENRKGWYTGDGMFYLYNGDLSHYSNHYWATVNPYKLPGTTETSAPREDDSGQGTLPSGFVGTNKLDEKNATAAMDFTNWNKTLTAHKSWFMLNGNIAFLGSAIQNRSNDTVSTTIEQRKENPESPYKVYVNDKEEGLADKENPYNATKSVFLESNDKNKNIGYFFFKKTDITMMKRIQEGTWKDINASQSDAKVQNTFITISQTHKGDGDSYSYMMIPNVDRTTFNQMVKDLEGALLKNNDKLQAVYDAQQQVWGIVKYDDSVSTISDRFQVRKRGLYTIRKEDNEYKVSYYNPETKSSASKDEVFKELAIAKPTDENSSKNKGKKMKESETETALPKGKKKTLPQTGEGATVLPLLGILLVGSGYVVLRLK